MRHLTATVDRIGLLQIDSVNVLTRAHYLPLFSRLGPYDRALLDRASGRAPRRLVEYWAHEASLVPPATQRLLRWRMRRSEKAWGGIRSIAVQNPELVQAVRDELSGRTVPMTPARSRPPSSTTSRAARSTGAGTGPRSSGRWSSCSTPARSARPAAPHPSSAGTPCRSGCCRARWSRRRDPTDEEAFVELIRIAARAHGVATLGCLRDYFRMRPDDTRGAVDALVDAGELLPAQVEGWSRPAYLHRDARLPRAVRARALLVPFDPLVWFRWRDEALFDFHYRIEIYTPAEKRVYGYYVLPFLLGERLVARVDLKADRQAADGGGVLRVRSAFAEPHAPPETAAELAGELAEMARWLGLGDIAVEPRGDLARALKAAVKRGGAPRPS